MMNDGNYRLKAAMVENVAGTFIGYNTALRTTVRRHNLEMLHMHVYVAINCPTDQPYWVTHQVFFDCFNQADFMNRDIKDVTQAYLQDWFYTGADGKQMFYIPVVGAIGARTDLVSSRHRLAVLLSHLEEIPFAFAFGYLSPEAKTFLDSIPKRPLDVAASIWLPDLTVCERLP